MPNKNILIIFSFLFLSGCVSVEAPKESVITKFPEPEQTGVYHKVKPGETLWRIAKTYDVSIDDIIRVNDIADVSKVEKDKLVLIPGAAAIKEIILDTDGAKNEFVWPVRGKVIRSFHQIQETRLNKGIDIKTSAGELVKAARTGRVVFADFLSGYGYTVILDHLDGFFSVYAQNARLLVKLGDMVVKNQEIAHVGQRNDLAYLHFEIRRNTVEDNPLYYLP